MATLVLSLGAPAGASGGAEGSLRALSPTAVNATPVAARVLAIGFATPTAVGGGWHGGAPPLPSARCDCADTDLDSGAAPPAVAIHVAAGCAKPQQWPRRRTMSTSAMSAAMGMSTSRAKSAVEEEGTTGAGGPGRTGAAGKFEATSLAVADAVVPAVRSIIVRDAAIAASRPFLLFNAATTELTAAAC